MNIIDLATKTMQTAIKSVVDAIKTVTDATKVKADTIDTNVSVVNASVGSSSDAPSGNGSLHAKLTSTYNKVSNIETNVNSLVNGRVVKSVQRGVTSIASNTNSRTVNISPVNMSKSIVIIKDSPNSPSTAPYSMFSYAILASPTQVTLERAYTGGHETNLSWQVIEFY